MTGTIQNSGPGYKEFPTHKISLESAPAPQTVRLNDVVLAHSSNALILNETNHGPVMYFPQKDVDFSLLTKSDQTTYCPFKGDASYWDFGGVENIAWSYPSPFDEVMEIKNYMAFYSDKVSF